MAAQDKATVKGYFETGDKPTQAQFETLIDSYQDTDAFLDSLASAKSGTGLIRVAASVASVVSAGSVGLLMLAADTTAAAQDVVGISSAMSVVVEAETLASARTEMGAQSQDDILDAFAGLAVSANNIFVGTDGGVEVVTPASALSVIGAQASAAEVTEVEVTAGTGTAVRMWTPAKVKLAAETHGGGGGRVLQVLQAVKTDTFSTTSTSFVDITGLSQAITPSSTSSKILVMVSLTNGGSTNTSDSFVIDRNGTDIAIGASAGSRDLVGWASGHDTSAEASGSHFSFLDSPASVSEQTYKVQMLHGPSGTGYINRDATDTNAAGTSRGHSSITVMEIDGT